jgi:hypothetical protein
MSLVLQSSGGGQITIQEPATASNFTQTLPAASGEVMVSGNQPAFSAYQSSAQSVANNTWTKVQLQTENFDTANAFDSTTNYRFTPLVAGYYQINGNTVLGLLSGTIGTQIYKNGSGASLGTYGTQIGGFGSSAVSTLIYLNGSTDYVELYVYQTSGVSQNTSASATNTSFSGTLVRTA